MRIFYIYIYRFKHSFSHAYYEPALIICWSLGEACERESHIWTNYVHVSLSQTYLLGAKIACSVGLRNYLGPRSCVTSDRYSH